MIHARSAEIAEALDSSGARWTLEQDGAWSFELGDRHGWLWLEDLPDRVVAHLSLLVADDPEEVRRYSEVVEALPQPLFCEYDHHADRDDEYIRAVARFDLDQGPRSFCKRVEQLAWLAEYVRSLRRSSVLAETRNAVGSLWATLGDAGLAAPPVPERCRDRVVEIGPWWWGSVLMSPFDMYMFESPWELVSGWDREPLFSMSHAGHGVNSYGLNLAVAAGPFAAFVQHGYGGAYSDPIMDRERIAATYARLHQVIDSVGSEDVPARWLLLMSDFRDIHQLVDLETSGSTPDLTSNRGWGYHTTPYADERELWRGLADRLPQLGHPAGIKLDW